jgi:hypothetical protein
VVDVGVGLVSHWLPSGPYQGTTGGLPDPTRPDPFPPVILTVIVLVSAGFGACVSAVGRGRITVWITGSINVGITDLSVIRR